MRMERRGAICALFSALIALPVAAQSVKLRAHEIDALISGNTIAGQKDGVNYRQFFAQDGYTIFAAEGAKIARGEWRIDNDHNEFQSIWPGDQEWEGAFVIENGGEFFWVSDANPPIVFDVFEGERLVPE